MKLPSSPGEIIKTARTKRKQNQQEFADFLHVTQSRVSRYETGDIENPPASIIIRCANILLEDETRRTTRVAEQLVALERSAGERVTMAISTLIDAFSQPANPSK